MAKYIKDNFLFLVGLLLTLSLLWPMFVAPYFTHHDDVQVIRLFQMDKCISDLQIPCRWVPDLGGHYGYPLFNYYGPLPYYYGELIYLLTDSFIISAKVMFATSFVLSYIFMFYLSRKLWGDLGGMISGVFYSFAPYHALDLYVRGAMGEMWALCFYPAVLWSLLRLSEKPVKQNVALVSVFIAMLVVSHNLSAMIFVPIALVFSGILFYKNRSSRFLYTLSISFILGFLLSAFYFIPAYFEKGLVHVETTTYGYFSYTEHFKGLRKVVFDNSWGYGASVREVPGGEKDGMSFQIGYIHLALGIMAAVVSLVLYKKEKFIALIIMFSLAVAVFCIFMINPKSEFIWKAFEPLKFLQFPWRFLMFITFFVSFVAGSVVVLFKVERFRNILAVFLVTVVVVVNFSYFKPEKYLHTDDSDYLSGANWEKQIKRSIFDYLPKSAKFPPRDLADKRYEILEGEVQILSFSEGSDWFKMNLDVKSPSRIRQSVYYFPEFQIRSNGKLLDLDNKNDLGLMTYSLGEGIYEVYGELKDTPIRTLGNSLSVLGFTLLTYLLYNKKGKVQG